MQRGFPRSGSPAVEVRGVHPARRGRGRRGGGACARDRFRADRAFLRGVQAGCLLTVSDIVVEGEFKRITDDELRAAVDRMTRVALATVTAGEKH